MKTTMKLAVLLVLSVSKAFALNSGLSPNYLNIKFYKLAVSASEYCTDLNVIIEDEEGETFDFLSNPTLGNGSVATGEYKCIAIEFSDIIAFSPDQNSTLGNCSMGVEYTEEICQRAEDSVLHLDGSQSACVQNQEQRIVLYLSTASTATGGEETESAFLPPAPGHLNRGLNLGGSLVVGQGISAKFVVDALGKLKDDGTCKFDEPPRFAFEEL